MASNSPVRSILVDGRWIQSRGVSTFQAQNPVVGSVLPDVFPVSDWEDCECVLDSAHRAYAELRGAAGVHIAGFLRRYANSIERNAQAIAAQAHIESGLPITPRLLDVELPRTVNQLRQAAMAAQEESWRNPTIDSGSNIRSYLTGVGPVCVFGPSNFPLAFGSVSGGDFAAAIAAGCPVIAKAHPLHPGTATLLAEFAVEAVIAAGLPSGTVQLLYHLNFADGERLVADKRIGATAFTGSRSSGLRLKRAADAVGKLTFLELSSVNPVIILPGALAERCSELVEEFCTSALLAGGQFCTNPGLVLLIASEASESFIQKVASIYKSRAAGLLMSAGLVSGLRAAVSELREAGAKLVAEGNPAEECGFSHPNVLLRASAAEFLSKPERFQTEAFGNATLIIVADSTSEAANVLTALEGNLTGCIYSARDGCDDADYDILATVLRTKVGRLLNDKMPTGVAVSPAMNHGGPYPATGHPHFTAVGIPAAIRRFGMLQCFDAVREHRLPQVLRNKNPTGAWRFIDGSWTQEDVDVRCS